MNCERRHVINFLSFVINFTRRLDKKGEINDVWETMLSSCKILNQPQVFK